MSAGVLILGAGHAGGTAAALLRQYGYEGPITMIGEEPIPPYQRPPLSKAWLKGEADADALTLKPESFYGEHNIDLRMNLRAVSINRGAKTVALSDGETLAYDQLIIATGSRARKLNIPGVDLKGIFELRSADDAERLKHAITPGKRLAVVGGGYIGLEVAASARALGADAVVVESESRVLQRVACEVLSTFFQNYHLKNGVTFELNARVEAFEGEGGQITAVRLADGRRIACDIALVGVGSLPNDEIAREAGLECVDGIVVDLEGRTADPSVFAIGDVAHRPLPFYNHRMFRLQSVPNALEQAKQVACAITGRPAPPAEVQWNWSDQYDIKLQLAGLPFDTDEIIVRGDPSTAKFAVFHLRQGKVQAVEAINAAPEFMVGKQLIASQKPVVREKLADSAVSMKEVAA